MIVTREWIFQHRTDAGAWTRIQIEALGIQWPPRHGWIDRIIGKEINARDQYIFEHYRVPHKIVKSHITDPKPTQGRLDV